MKDRVVSLRKQSLVAAVIGATGVVGSELVQALCADPQFTTVHTLGRHAPHFEGGTPDKLRHHKVDFAQLDADTWPRADVLFCCLGTTIKQAGSQAGFQQVDFDFVVQAAQCARQARTAQLMVVSAMGADANSRVFYNRVKGQMEQAVVGLGFQSVGLFRPSLLRAKRTEFRAGERLALQLMKLGDYLVPKKYRSVQAAAVARAMLQQAKIKTRGVHIIESDSIQAFTL
jgi:uncharacterized protein YbjT (DUF2867 family)